MTNRIVHLLFKKNGDANISDLEKLFKKSPNYFFKTLSNNLTTNYMLCFQLCAWLGSCGSHGFCGTKIYQGSFCHYKVFANAFSLKSKAPTYFTQYCDLLDPWLEISLNVLLDIVQMSPSEQIYHFRWGRSTYLKNKVFWNFYLRGVNIGATFSCWPQVSRMFQ